MKTIRKQKLILDRKAEYLWNVQLWYSYDGGKFFKHGDEARAYLHEHRTPLRVFPLITPALQKEYEENAALDGTPDICGHYGYACRQMNEEEGANRMLCMNCKLQEFCHAAEMMAFARS